MTLPQWLVQMISFQTYKTLHLSFNSIFPANVAMNKPTAQSSTYNVHTEAGAAIDGHKSGIFGQLGTQCTKAEKDPWWSCDLLVKRLVYMVKVYNRAKCCRKYRPDFCCKDHFLS